jgi:hypothetical protein
VALTKGFSLAFSAGAAFAAASIVAACSSSAARTCAQRSSSRLSRRSNQPPKLDRGLTDRGRRRRHAGVRRQESTMAAYRSGEKMRVTLMLQPAAIASSSASSPGSVAGILHAPPSRSDPVRQCPGAAVTRTRRRPLLPPSPPRSTAQGEALSPITTFLMLVPASIVSLALIGQVTRSGMNRLRAG